MDNPADTAFLCDQFLSSPRIRFSSRISALRVIILIFSPAYFQRKKICIENIFSSIRVRPRINGK